MIWLKDFKDIKGLNILFEEGASVPKIVIGVDPSWGVNDYSAIVGLDIKTGRQILEYQNRVTHSVLLEVLQKISEEEYYFLVKCVLIEGNLGRDLIERYLNWIQSLESEKRLKMPMVYKDEKGNDFVITSMNRPLLLLRVKEVLMEHPEIVTSKRLFDELNNLILDKRGREKAAPGYHDDLVFAFALALKCRDDYIIHWASLDEFRDNTITDVKKKYIFPMRGFDLLDQEIEERKKLGLPTKDLEIEKMLRELNNQ